jgi:hypothetical protein
MVCRVFDKKTELFQGFKNTPKFYANRGTAEKTTKISDFREVIGKLVHRFRGHLSSCNPLLIGAAADRINFGAK